VRAILIDANARTVTEVETPGTLESYQAVVGGYIERALELPNLDWLVVNEDGLHLQPENWFIFHGFHQPLAGNGLLLGSNADGETTPAKTPLALIRSRVTFIHRTEIAIAQSNGDLQGWLTRLNAEMAPIGNLGVLQ
jgi:hypothetical protein